MAQSQAKPLVTPCNLMHRILKGERTPCLPLPMLSHRLLLAWGATLSFEGVTPFPGCTKPSLPNLGVLSLAPQGTGPWLPPDCVAAVPCVSENDLVHQGTSAAGGTYLQGSPRMMEPTCLEAA
jgi:hypothetical protein